MRRAYCLLEGHPTQHDALYTLGVILMTAGRYRAAYEALFLAIERGSQPFDGFHTWRVGFLRALLRAAADREEARQPPFPLCGPDDAPGCPAAQVCARDYFRFNAGFCPTTVQLDQSCPGVCVPEAIYEAELGR